jgi:hypothetical protein
VKLKLNLSLTASPVQRWATSAKTATLLRKVPPVPTATCPSRKASPFALLTNRVRKPVRIPTPFLTPRPVFRGNKSYLRALRAAELAAWNANLKFPTF